MSASEEVTRIAKEVEEELNKPPAETWIIMRCYTGGAATHDVGYLSKEEAEKACKYYARNNSEPFPEFVEVSAGRFDAVVNEHERWVIQHVRFLDQLALVAKTI